MKSILGLTRALLPRPKSLAHILNLLDGAEYYQAFEDIIKRVLPRQDVARVLAKSEDFHQAHEALRLIDQRYKFKVTDYALDGELFEPGEAYNQFEAYGIPISYCGVGEEDWHSFAEHMRPGWLMAAIFVESPFDSFMGDDMEGIRIPMLEAVADVVGVEQVKRVPKEGMGAGALHKRLVRDKRFAAVEQVANILWLNTGSIYYDYSGEEYNGPLYIDWDMESIRELEKQWALYEEISVEVSALVKYLEADPKKHFGELLDVLVPKRKKRAKTLEEVHA